MTAAASLRHRRAVTDTGWTEVVLTQEEAR